MESVAVIDRGVSDQIRQRVLKMCNAPHTWMGKRQFQDHTDVNFSLQSAVMTLPAPVPDILTRCALPKLKEHAYWVCDKSQGSRTMIYAEGGAVYFIDSRFFVFLVATVPRDVVADTFVRGPTLLDGHMQDRTFTLFDVVELNGVSMRQCKLSERLTAIGGIVIAQYRETLRPHLFFELVGKRMHRVNRLDDVLRYFRKRDYRTYHYDDGVRNHASRGLVFVPEDQPYCASHRQYDLEIFKWSFPGQQSVDLKICEPFVGNAKLFCTTESLDTDIWCASSTLTRSQSHKMVGTNESELIVRCIRNGGKWCVVEIRKDRNRPNTVMQFVRIMESMLEPISRDEIAAACSPETR